MKRKMAFMLPILLFSSLMVSLGETDAAEVGTSEKEATFEITPNLNGTLNVEAENLSFGNHALSPNDVKAKAKENTTIDVTEFSGVRPGWRLQVQMKKFEDGSKVARGIELFYPKVTPITETGGGASQNPPIIHGPNKSFIDNLDGTIVKDDDVPVRLATAGVGSGYGKWVLPYNFTDGSLIQLKIPAGQQVGNYSTKLTYTALEGP